MVFFLNYVSVYSYLDVGYFYNLYFCVQMCLTITEFLGQVQVSKEPL